MISLTITSSLVTHLRLLIQKNNSLVVYSHQLLSNRCPFEPSGRRDANAEKGAVVAGVGLATLDVEVLGIALGEILKLNELCLDSLEDVLGFGESRRESRF